MVLFLAASVIPNHFSGTSSRRSSSTVSNAALRSSITTTITSWFSILQSMSFTSFTRMVLQLCCFLYADWYSGSKLFWLQCFMNCSSVTFSTTFEMNPTLLTGLWFVLTSPPDGFFTSGLYYGFLPFPHRNYLYLVNYLLCVSLLVDIHLVPPLVCL